MTPIRNALWIPVLVLSLAPLAGQQQPSSAGQQAAQERVPAKRQWPLSETRSFYMGFTPWPYEFSEEAVEYTYRTIREHAGLLVHHLDTGVPWPEALAGEPYHPAALAELEQRKANSRGAAKIYVAATPQAQDRASLAKYWGGDQHQEPPEPWDQKNFDDPHVIRAYLNYCNFLIDYFKPDYFAYGIEVNGGLRLDHPNFKPFRKFASEVYSALKKKHPRLPVFLTFQTGSFEASWEEQKEVNRALIEYSDYVGMSTYPFWAPGRIESDATGLSDLPEDWFDQMASLAPDKPFAITETGYIAEPLEIKAAGLQIDGNETWQTHYVDFLLRSANRLNAEFVVWFVLRDYDAAWKALEELGFPEAFKIWKDTGLFDGEGRAREGLKVWDRWLARPIRQ